MTYSSTLSYVERRGVRCGTCFEYPAFDPVANAILNIRIRPLIATECTLITPALWGRRVSDIAFADFQQLKDACRAVNGTFTLLWLNAQLDTQEDRSLYQQVITA